MWIAIWLILIATASAQPGGLAEKERLARELITAGKPEQAIPLLDELVRAAPNDPGLALNLAIANFKAKRYRQAIEQAHAALKLKPDLTAANLFLGASWVELGEPAQGVAPLEKVVASQPNDRNARAMLASALLALERFDEAIQQFRKAAELMPDNPRVWYGLGRSYDGLAAAFEQEVVKGGSAYALVLSADAYLKQRRYGSAYAKYREALEKLPALRGLHAGLAAVYKDTGHPGLAAAEEQLESKVSPCGAPGPQCEFASGRYRQISEAANRQATPEAQYWSAKAFRELAQQAYMQLTELPPSLELHLHAATTYDAKGLDAEASREWRAALTLSPENREIKKALMQSLFQRRDFDALLPLLRESLAQDPAAGELNFMLGASLLNRGQPDQAIPYLETAVQRSPSLFPAHAALGEALLRAGKPRESIPHLKAALGVDEDGNLHFQLARAYQLTGQADLGREALAAYQQFRSSAERKKRMEEGLDMVR